MFENMVQFTPGVLQPGQGAGLGLYSEAYTYNTVYESSVSCKCIIALSVCLSLAVTKKIVELHGGTVFVVSTGEGEGSTFTVRLPCIIAPDIDLPLLAAGDSREGYYHRDDDQSSCALGRTVDRPMPFAVDSSGESPHLIEDHTAAQESNQLSDEIKVAYRPSSYQVICRSL